MRAQQKLVTIHGASSTGEWQNAVRDLLFPHFRCEKLSYTEYSGQLGIIRTILVPVLVPLVGAAFFTALGLWILRLQIASTIAGLVGLMFGLVSFGVARVQRLGIRNKLKRKWDALTIDSAQPPHVIAHSFGSYIAGRILQKFPDVQFGRVIFVGCVLPRSFGWQGLLGKRPQAFEHVRNECGDQDWVVRLSGIAGIIARDLGDAGMVGFQGEAGLIHHGTDPLDGCIQCGADVSVARVHNVPLKEFVHSDQLLGSGHILKLWLPDLWGFPPREFQEYVNLCWRAAQSFEREDREKVALYEVELRSRRWSWLPASLEEFLEQRVALELDDRGLLEDGSDWIPDIVDEATGLLYWIVFDAWEAHTSREITAPDINVARALHPYIASVRAIRGAIDAHV